jgi:hypothetical protein
MEREHDCRLVDAASRRASARAQGRVVIRPISRVIPLIIAGIVGIGAGVGIALLAATHASVATPGRAITTSVASSAQWPPGAPSDASPKWRG